MDKAKYLEFVAQSHQPISAFAYPSKITTGNESAIMNLGLKGAQRPKRQSRPAKSVTETYRPVVQQANNRAKVKLH